MTPRSAVARRPRWRAVLAALLALVGLAPGHVAAFPTAGDLRAALDAACARRGDADAVLAALGGGIQLGSESLDAPEGMQARRRKLMLPDGTRLRVDTHERGERLAQVILEAGQRQGASLRPRYWVVADGECRVRVARRLDYGDGEGPVALQVLGDDLATVRSTLDLDLPVPPGAVPAGVPVAMVDSGVNYSLPGIASRLARRADGTLIGYDYWDLDPRPFDSHPSRSPFLPLRHGTRTASLVLADAPVATIAPMRYPRPDMSRMARLVADAAASGIVIVNLSLGGRDRGEWEVFAKAARAQPQMLFIASAGNDGRDLDRDPVYPAALDLDNLVTVTSADAQGLPARGSNWGRRTVDLLVAAEGLAATDYNGYAVRVSGSSYAAARVSALAACLKGAHPDWNGPELRQALFAMARQPVHPSTAYVAVGLLEEPTFARRGACPAEPAVVTDLGRLVLSGEAIHPSGAPGGLAYRLAPLSLVWIEDAGWRVQSLVEAVSGAARILAQCGLDLDQVSVRMLRAPRGLRYFDDDTALALAAAVRVAPPSAWFVRDTLREPAFDAEAIGRSNLGGRKPLLDTVWLTSHLKHPQVALAHELYHVIADTGSHVPERDNLMQLETSPEGTRLTDAQCERLVRVGKAFGLVTDAPAP